MRMSTHKSIRIADLTNDEFRSLMELCFVESETTDLSFHLIDGNLMLSDLDPNVTRASWGGCQKIRSDEFVFLKLTNMMRLLILRLCDYVRKKGQDSIDFLFENYNLNLNKFCQIYNRLIMENVYSELTGSLKPSTMEELLSDH